MPVRIKDLTGADTIATDDKLVIDGATNGPRSFPGGSATPGSYVGVNGAGQLAALDRGLDGRTILEAGSVSDESAEFLSGTTFNVNPANPRHYNLQVGDADTALTANMTVDLGPASAAWPRTARLIVSKGSDDAYSVTISGLDADGLGSTTLVDQYEGVILGYHHTDDEDGPGTYGQKWKIVGRFTRTRKASITADLVAFDAGESGASGANVEAAVQDAGDRIAALEAGGGSIGTLSTANATAQTSNFNLTASNASTYISGSTLNVGTIIPVDTSGGAVVATMVGTIDDLPGKTWLLNVSGSGGCTVERPQTWEFSRTGDTTATSDIVENIDISGILDGMGVTGTDDEIPDATTVADADYDTDQIQLSAAADETQASATLVFSAGEVGTINGISADATLRPGLNLVHCISADETTGVVVVTGAQTQALEVADLEDTSRNATEADLYKIIPLGHASNAVDLTVTAAMDAAVPAGAWFVIFRTLAGAASALGAGPPTVTSPTGFTEETAAGAMTTVWKYADGDWRRHGGLVAS